MLPLAPGRFSITTDQLSVSLRDCAKSRAEISGAPPGGIVTSTRIGRLGNGWACAAPVKRAATAIAAHTLRAILIIGFLLRTRRRLWARIIPSRRRCHQRCLCGLLLLLRRIRRGSRRRGGR